jgi:hypothetical protein
MNVERKSTTVVMLLSAGRVTLRVGRASIICAIALTQIPATRVMIVGQKSTIVAMLWHVERAIPLMDGRVLATCAIALILLLAQVKGIYAETSQITVAMNFFVGCASRGCPVLTMSAKWTLGLWA